VDEYFTGDYGRAQAAFATLEGQVPLNEVTNDLSVTEARRGNYSSAQAGFERAYQSDPLDPDFSFNLAACLWQLKKYGDATAPLEASLGQDADDPEAHSLLALVFTKLQNSARAQEQEKWLASHQQQLASLQNFTPEFRIKKRYDGKAFGLLQVMLHNTLEARLSQESPEEHGETHLSQGKKLLSEGRFAEAERELDEVVSLIPENSEAYLVLGQIYEGEGRHEEAAAEFKTALQHDNSAVTHLWLGRVYLSLNQNALALEQGRAALSLQPGSAEAQRLVDDARKRSGAKASGI
jgi:predicted Zn-dependent protease